MTDEHSALFAPSGRSREESLLNLLRDWLQRPTWHLGPRGPNRFAGFSEAECLLVGIDPEQSVHGEEGFGWEFLPGALEWFGYEQYPPSAEYRELDALVLEVLQRVSSLPELGSRDVPEIVAHALKHGVTPPWLPTARADPDCAVHLPAEAQPSAVSVDVGQRFRTAQKAKAIDRWKRDERTQRLAQVGRSLFLEWRALPQEERSSRASLADTILDAFTKQFPDEQAPAARTVERHIKKWNED